MVNFTKYIIYFLMITIGLVAMYTLLNAGSPNSLLRPFFPDPITDVYVAVVSSVLVFILGFFVFYSRDREGLNQIVQMNSAKIKKLRKNGKKDEDIAESILVAMGSRKGYRHTMMRKKLVVYLAEFK